MLHTLASCMAYRSRDTPVMELWYRCYSNKPTCRVFRMPYGAALGSMVGLPAFSTLSLRILPQQAPAGVTQTGISMQHTGQNYHSEIGHNSVENAHFSARGKPLPHGRKCIMTGYRALHTLWALVHRRAYCSVASSRARSTVAAL